MFYGFCRLHICMFSPTYPTCVLNIMINLQIARERVSQTDTACVMIVKLVWNRRKIPQAMENFFSGSLSLPSSRYMWNVKGMFSIMTRQSATAIPVRMRLMGLDLMSLWVSTMMFSMLKTVPMQHTTKARYP